MCWVNVFLIQIIVLHYDFQIQNSSGKGAKGRRHKKLKPSENLSISWRCFFLLVGWASNHETPVSAILLEVKGAQGFNCRARCVAPSFFADILWWSLWTFFPLLFCSLVFWCFEKVVMFDDVEWCWLDVSANDNLVTLQQLLWGFPDPSALHLYLQCLGGL